MEITLLHITECPNWEETGERLARALGATGHGDAPVNVVLLNTAEDAARYLFAGSPTILVDGADLFPGAETLPELACRVYRVGTRFAGAPSEEQLVDALRQLPGRAQR
ncbi:thioredoxin family protein [Parafrigoribacterium soli]|uniref:thioredoxin family protein n=1 Tax=Parafrigoribacterium soli TaxID=3144663 RepID=UPI0032EDD2C4